MSFRKGKIVYLSETERNRLKRLAAREQMSDNEYIRLLIDRADLIDRMIDPPKKAKKQEAAEYV